MHNFSDNDDYGVDTNVRDSDISSASRSCDASDVVTCVWNRQTVKTGGPARNYGRLPRSLSTVLETSAGRRRSPNPPLHRRGSGHRWTEVGQGRKGHGWHPVWSAWLGTRQTVQVPRQGRQLRRRKWSSCGWWRNTRQRSLWSVNLGLHRLSSLPTVSCILLQPHFLYQNPNPKPDPEPLISNKRLFFGNS